MSPGPGTIAAIKRVRSIWVVAVAALCALCAGALIALASSGGSGGKPALSGLEARLSGSGSALIVSGYARETKNVLGRYRRNCRVVRTDSSARGPGSACASPSRAPPSGPAAVTPRSPSARAGPPRRIRRAKQGPIRVFACADGRCAERRLALRASTGAPPPAVVGGSRVTVAPGVTVRVPSAPPVSPDVPATRFVKPDGSDSGVLRRLGPCRSFNRAYEVAAPGEVVDVAGGTYPDQQVEHDSSKTSATDVFFRPAAGTA